MSPEAIAAFVQLGIAGTMLYLFVTGKIVTASSMKDALDRSDTEKSEIRRDRDQWRDLALGSEERVDQAVPIVAAAVGAKTLRDDYESGDRALRRPRR